jgi:hypothetical protein
VTPSGGWRRERSRVVTVNPAQVKVEASTSQSPPFEIQRRFEKSPPETRRTMPHDAIPIPAIWARSILSPRKTRARIAMEIGATAMSQPEWVAVVYLRPVNWMRKWRSKIPAPRRRVLPSRPVSRGQRPRRRTSASIGGTARTRRRPMISTTERWRTSTLVATNDHDQRIAARRGRR